MRNTYFLIVIFVFILMISGCQEAVGGNRNTASADSSYVVSTREMWDGSEVTSINAARNPVAFFTERYGNARTGEIVGTKVDMGYPSNYYSGKFIGQYVSGPNKIGCWRILDYMEISSSYSARVSKFGSVPQSKGIKIFTIIRESSDIPCAQQSASQIASFTEEEFARAIKYQ